MARYSSMRHVAVLDTEAALPALRADKITAVIDTGKENRQ